MEVPNVTLYFQKGDPALPASYADYILKEYFLTSGESHLSKYEWDLISQGKVSMSLEDWDKLNIMVSKMCSQISCDYDTLQRIKQLTINFHEALQ